MKTIVKRTMAVALLLSVCTYGSMAQSLEDPIPLDPDLKTGTLDNGLVYYIKKNQKPEKRAELRLVLNAGSILEDEDQQGLAHFVEHMCFNGTEHFEKSELVDYLESIGVQFGPHLNAYTSFDETVYMLKIPTDSKKIVSKGFQILEDWAHLVSFEDEEIDKERGVVIEEWRSRLGPENRMMYQTLPVTHHGSRYPERLPIGKKEILESFDYETIRRFYRDWYRPDLMAVIAVGDFDVKDIEKKIKSHFSKLQNPERPRERTLFPVPDHKEPKMVVATDPEAAYTYVNMIHKHSSEPMETMADYRRDIMHSLYSQMIGQRYDELKEQANPPYVFAYSAYSEFTRTKDSYSSFAMVAPDGIERGLQTLLEENERVFSHGFTKSELERAKKSVLKLIETRYKERDKTNSRSYASGYVSHFLSGSPVPGAAFTYEKYKKFLPGITLEEVNMLARKWITDDNVVITVTAPEKEGITVPTKKRLLELYKAHKENINPYEDTFQAEKLIHQPPTPSEIVREEKMDDIGVTALHFKNGAKVVLKPTTFKNDQILFGAYSYGGHSLYSDEDYISANTAGSIVAGSGIGELNKIDLQKFLAGKRANLMPYIGNITEGLGGSTTKDDLNTFMEMLYLYFTQPRKDKISFESYKAQQKMFLANISAQPDLYFMMESAKVMTQDHPRGKVFTEVEDLDKINLDKAVALYKDRFSDASDFTFFFVGNFDVESIKPLLKTYIGGLPAKNRKESWKDTGIRYPKGVVTKELKKGSEPKSKVNIAFHGAFEWNYQNRYDMTSLIEVLKIKLRESMREEQGGVYGVSVYPSLSRYPKEEYEINISFNCAPENVEQLTKTVMQEAKAPAGNIGLRQKPEKSKRDTKAESGNQPGRKSLLAGTIDAVR